MAKFYNPIDSFKQAEQEYANTTPVRTRTPIDETEQHSLHQWLLHWDVRPISCRARKHERTVKISKNHYALVDGDTTYLGWYTDQKYTKDEFLHVCSKMAPINWYRNRKGEEFMTIRNVTTVNEGAASIGRNDFINRHAPRANYLHSDNGKQFFGRDYLPKRNYISKNMMEKIKASQGHNNTQWMKNMVNQLSVKGDYKLVYKHINGVYTLVSEPHKIPKVVIDKEVKRKYKDTIREFRDTACALAMMLKGSQATIDNDVEDKLDVWLCDGLGQKQDRAYSHQTKYADVLKSPTGWQANNVLRTIKDQNKFRSLVLQMMHPDHKFNYALITMFAFYNNSFWEDGVITARYNNWVNQVCRFKKTIKVDQA